MLLNFLSVVLLALAAPSDKLTVTKGPLPDGGSFELQVRTEKDGSHVKHGYAKYFDATGKLNLSGRHAKGRRTGKWEAWHPGGLTAWTGNYKKGVRCKQWRFYDSKGVQIDHLTGKWALLDQLAFGDATRTVGYTVNGVPQGFWRIDWWNGQLFTSGIRTHGLREGPWRTFHFSGAPTPNLATGDFREGKRIGPAGDDLPNQPHLADPELPEPKPYTRKEQIMTPRAAGLYRFIEENKERLGDPSQSTADERKRMLAELVGYLGGHGFGWRWGDSPADRATRSEALTSTDSLIALLATETFFWAFPGDGSAPPELETLPSTFLQSFSPFQENWGTAHALAKTTYKERSVRSMQTASNRRKERRAIEASLKWLAKVQQTNGHWTVTHNESDTSTLGTFTLEEQKSEVGLTSLALLAFMANDSKPLSGPHTDTIVNGLKALLNSQKPSGQFRDKTTTHHAIYAHCLGTYALAEALGISGHPALLEPTQRAVTYLLSVRATKSGWRYDMPSQGDVDTSATAWAFQALYAAHVAGIPLDEEVVDHVVDWVDQVSDSKGGRVGYIGPAAGGRSSRIIGKNDSFRPEAVEAMTGAGLALRYLAAGAKGPGSKPFAGICDKHEGIIARTPLSWEEDAQDSYYAYFGTLASSLVRSQKKGRTSLRKWQQDANTLILKGQIKSGEAAGSWAPDDAWGIVGGRVFTTAMYTLAIENQWRYAR